MIGERFMGVRVRAPGTCGELVQGTIEGQNFLITCPIDVYSTARCIKQTGKIHDKIKTMTAVEKVKEYLNIDSYISVEIESDLPCGKGMASSSADISAACQAVAAFFGQYLTPDDIAKIALSIEPTDGVFYRGIVMFDHVTGTFCRYLGEPPEIKIAVFDMGGEVDTKEFNKRNDLKFLNNQKEPIIKKAVELVVSGLQQNNTRMIGLGATMSARANQAILFKPHLEDVIKIALDSGAVGVNAAHSGTVIGVLFDKRYLKQHDECIKQILKISEEIKYLMTCSLISGGLKIIEDDSNATEI